MFDVVLENGWIVDGSGAPPTRADLALEGDRIAAVGSLEHAEAAARVDCRAQFLLPGFIDAHVHTDALVFEPEVQLAMLAQGVTSCVVGQDGLSFAPASVATAAYVGEYFGAVNGQWPGGRGGLNGYREQGADIAGLLAMYDRATAVNVGCLVPHGNLRLEALGSAATPADGSALKKMGEQLSASLDDGALGISSGLEYVPGSYANTDELAWLCGIAARRGVPYVTHMRGYEAAAPQGMAEVRTIAERSGVAVHVSHYHGAAKTLIGLIDDMRASGTDATFDSYPYTSGSSILAMVALPAALQGDGPAATLARLGDSHVRAALSAGWFAEHADDLTHVRLSYVASEDYVWAEGQTLLEAAEFAGTTVADFVCDVLVASKLRVGCVVRHPLTTTEEDVRAMLRHEAQIAGSDGIYLGSRPHPRGWGAFARLLGRHTRDLGDLTWAQAAGHLSNHPARRFGLTDRGLLRKDFAADVVVLNPSVVADVATYDDPRRPAVGVNRVYVSGELVFCDGQLTGATPGRSLRRGQS